MFWCLVLSGGVHSSLVSLFLWIRGAGRATAEWYLGLKELKIFWREINYNQLIVLHIYNECEGGLSRKMQRGK